MTSGQIAQIALAAMASVAVFSLVRTGIDAESRRMCAPLCALRPDYAGRNRLAPDFELDKISGGSGRLSDYRGQAIVLNFWSKSCRPCLDEMPSLAQFAKVLKAHGDISLLTISTDDSVDDARTTVLSVLGGDPPFVVFVDPDAKVVTGKYGTKLYPETWFIDKHGIIRARVDGARDWSLPLPFRYATTLLAPTGCDIRVTRGVPHGRWAPLCDEVPPAG